MKNITVVFGLIFITFIFILGCFKSEDLKTFTPLTKDNVSAKKIWERMTIETNYWKYKLWPGHQGIQPGQAPHGRFHQIFINPTLYNALPIKNRIAPNGSLIVKENYNIKKELKAITIMLKVKDYNPEANDWYWVKFSNTGKIAKEGKPKGCIQCHGGIKQNDYVIIQKLDKSINK